MEVGRPPRRLKRLSPPAAGPRPDGDLHRGDRGSIRLFLAPRAGLGRRGTEPQASGRKKGNRKPRASSQGTPGSPAFSQPAERGPLSLPRRCRAPGPHWPKTTTNLQPKQLPRKTTLVSLTICPASSPGRRLKVSAEPAGWGGEN